MELAILIHQCMILRHAMVGSTSEAAHLNRHVCSRGQIRLLEAKDHMTCLLGSVQVVGKYILGTPDLHRINSLSFWWHRHMHSGTQAARTTRKSWHPLQTEGLCIPCASTVPSVKGLAPLHAHGLPDFCIGLPFSLEHHKQGQRCSCAQKRSLKHLH